MRQVELRIPTRAHCALKRALSLCIYSGCGSAVDRLGCGPSAQPCGPNWHSGLLARLSRLVSFPSVIDTTNCIPNPACLVRNSLFPQFLTEKRVHKTASVSLHQNVTDAVSTLVSVPGSESPICAQSVPA